MHPLYEISSKSDEKQRTSDFLLFSTRNREVTHVRGGGGDLPPQPCQILKSPACLGLRIFIWTQFDSDRMLWIFKFLISKIMLLLTEQEVHTRCVRSIRLERQNKYFPYGPSSRLIRALLYSYPNKPV